MFFEISKTSMLGGQRVVVAKKAAGLAKTCCAPLTASFHSNGRINGPAAMSVRPVARYGGRNTVTMLPGNGIGPEMMEHVQRVMKVTGAPLDFEKIVLDPSNDNDEDLHNAIQSVKRNGCAIKGNIETIYNRPDQVSRNIEMRNALDLFVNVVKCKSYSGVKTRHDNIDVVLIRQNTEGEYAMLEHENVPGVVESLKIVTEKNTERLCRYAFDYAVEHGRHKVSLVHKANIMKVTDGLFLEVSNRIAKEYPDIKHENIIIDNCCMQLVSNPWQFDVMILTNLYGTIVSNLICGLMGGPGLISGANFGPKYAIFEPGTRNTGTKLTGQNEANPVAMLNASTDMLEYLGHAEHAQVIRSAIDTAVNVEKLHTKDLCMATRSTQPPVSTSHFMDAIISLIKNRTN